MTNAEHDPLHEDRAFAQRLRRALDPGLGPDAADRIADGAWRRARADSAAPRTVRTPRRTLRWAAAAAVLLAVAGGSIVLTRPTDAFAVEGEPVRVWHDDGWSASSRVKGAATVFAPAGTRALRARDGASIQPTAGSLFTIQPEHGHRFVVRVLRGSVEVNGTSLHLDVGDLAARPATADGSVALVAQMLSDEPSTLAPPRLPVAASGSVPQIEVRAGCVVVQNLGAGETRRLGANEIVTLGADRRLMDVLRWSEDIAQQVVAGAITVDADATPRGEMVLHLRVDDGRLTTLVPKVEMPEVLTFVNFATFENALRLQESPTGTFRVHHVRACTPVDAGALRELVREKDGRVTVLQVLEDGRVRIEDGGAVSIHPSLSAARRTQADVVALFDTYLDD